jgi:bifunctional DNA-binding transcriptional regulator/antitoxin component of YhaV-PrlF toxin-antitoxin module
MTICCNHQCGHSSHDFEDKVQGIVGDQSFSIVLPKHYAINLGIGKGDFVKVFLESDRIIVEKADL